MMISLKRWVFRLALTLNVSVVASISTPIFAQIPTNPGRNADIDDLPNTPDQLISWTCIEGDKQIQVEVKNVPTWQAAIAGDRWQCQQRIADVPPNALKFSCEPSTDIIGILTITWLQGEDEQQQMGRWMHQFADQQNMVCQMAKVQLWEEEEGVVP